jgi:hypothetical protein
MSIGDLDQRVNPPAVPDTLDPKLDALLTLADEAQQLWTGSFIEIVVHIPAEDFIWRDGAEITDAYTLYSVKLARRAS